MVKSLRQSFRNTNTLNYDFKSLLKGKHTLNVLAGQEYIKAQSEALTTTVHAFPSSFTFYDARRLSTQGVPFSTENYLDPDDVLMSFFGRGHLQFRQ